MNKHFKIGVKHSSCQHMFQHRINLRRRSAHTVKALLIAMCRFYLNFHHFINHSSISCSFRAAQKKLKFLRIILCIEQHVKHTVHGYLSHMIRLFLCRKLRKFILRLTEMFHHIMILLIYQRSKQFFLTLVISIKCTGRNSGHFHNIPKRSCLKSFFQKFLFCRYMNLF